MSSGEVILYKGSRGKGKTLSMSFDAKLYFQDGWVVYSNYSLSFAQRLSNEEILALNKDSDLRNCVIAVDELQTLFDSRSWTSKTSLTFSYFLQQIRKRNIVFLATSQFVNLVDKRFRQQIDYFAYPQLDLISLWCKVTYVDMSFLEDVDLEVLSKGSLSFGVIKKFSVIYDASLIFPLYDTFEMIV